MSNNKKTFENILKFSSIIGIIVFVFYKIFENYSVDSARNHYQTKSYKDYSLLESEGDALQEKLNSDSTKINTSNIKNEELRRAISELLPELTALDEVCKREFENSLPSKRIIDPEDNFFESPEELFTKARVLIDQSSKRSFVISKLTDFSKVLAKMDEIDSELFYSVLRGHLICKSHEFNIFMESLYEASKNKKWSQERLTEGFDNLLSYTSDSLEYDFLPDNILFSLNIIKTSGQASELGDEFYQEIDVIYSELAAFEDRFADMTEGVIKSPIKYYDEYISELEQIADETRYLIERKREGRFRAKTAQ